MTNLLCAIWYCRDVRGNLAHAGAILLQALLCSAGQDLCALASGRVEPTELADELLGGLVDICVGELEVLDNGLGLSLECHGECLRDRRGGWKGKGVFADGRVETMSQGGRRVARFEQGIGGEEVGMVASSGR